MQLEQDFINQLMQGREFNQMMNNQLVADEEEEESNGQQEFVEETGNPQHLHDQLAKIKQQL